MSATRKQNHFRFLLLRLCELGVKLATREIWPLCSNNVTLCFPFRDEIATSGIYAIGKEFLLLNLLVVQAAFSHHIKVVIYVTLRT